MELIQGDFRLWGDRNGPEFEDHPWDILVKRVHRPGRCKGIATPSSEAGNGGTVTVKLLSTQLRSPIGALPTGLCRYLHPLSHINASSTVFSSAGIYASHF